MLGNDGVVLESDGISLVWLRVKAERASGQTSTSTPQHLNTTTLSPTRSQLGRDVRKKEKLGFRTIVAAQTLQEMWNFSLDV